MTSTPWTADQIPDQRGRSALVTGAGSGIGYEAALALAGHGAQVLLAGRSLERTQAAAERIRQTHPRAELEVIELDLASLASVRQAAAAIGQRHQRLDMLINNAGVMALPYGRTADGFEMQFGTNHLGHFALTGLLLPALLATPGARIVTVSSGLHTRGTIDFDNLDGARGYERWAAYSQSKLANLLFAYELQRRLAAAGSSAISLGCHPGYAATNLQAAGPRMEGRRLQLAIMALANRLIAQPAAAGALPTLYAATAATASGDDYIGPTGMGGMRGSPARQRSSERSYDQASAARLWQVSERLTGVQYVFGS